MNVLLVVTKMDRKTRKLLLTVIYTLEKIQSDMSVHEYCETLPELEELEEAKKQLKTAYETIDKLHKVVKRKSKIKITEKDIVWTNN